MATVEIEGQGVETSLTEATVILNLELGKVSNRRKLKSDTEVIQTDIDRNSLHVGVDLFDAPELRACQNFQAQLRAQVRLYCVPSFLRGGMYLVKLEAVNAVNELLKKAKEEFVPIVQAFADVVDQRRDESRERLKQAFDPGAYPSREQVMSVYRIDYRWLSMSTPTSLKKISVEFFNQEKARAEDSLKAATNGITAMLAAEAKGLGDHLIERLTPDVEGKPRIIRNSAVGNITEFLSTFNLRNIGTSEELNAQVERMKKLVEGVDPKDLRMNESLRTSLAKDFKEVSAALDRLVVEKPKRYMASKEEF